MNILSLLTSINCGIHGREEKEMVRSFELLDLGEDQSMGAGKLLRLYDSNIFQELERLN
jgi:hypothetical protein